jgi:hypothetical protein
MSANALAAKAIIEGYRKVGYALQYSVTEGVYRFVNDRDQAILIEVERIVAALQDENGTLRAAVGP